MFLLFKKFSYKRKKELNSINYKIFFDHPFFILLQLEVYVVPSSGKTYDGLNDQELIEKYRAERDKNIVGELYKRHTAFAFAVCMKFLRDKEESQDSVMQIFEELFGLLCKHEIVHFKSWLFMVIKNHCLKILSRRSRERDENEKILKSETAFMENDVFSDLNSVMEKEQQYLKLEKILPRLPSEQRVCVELFYLHNKCYKDIADAEGFTLMQVKSHIQNGKRNLKNLLTSENETD